MILERKDQSLAILLKQQGFMVDAVFVLDTQISPDLLVC